MGKKKKKYMRTCEICGNEVFSMSESFVCCFCKKVNKKKRSGSSQKVSE